MRRASVSASPQCGRSSSSVSAARGSSPGSSSRAVGMAAKGRRRPAGRGTAVGRKQCGQHYFRYASVPVRWRFEMTQPRKELLPMQAPPSPRRWWALLVLSLSLIVISLDNTILNVAIPSMKEDLGASATQMQWIVDAYMLVFAGMLLTIGALGDRFGRKK